ALHRRVSRNYVTPTVVRGSEGAQVTRDSLIDGRAAVVQTQHSFVDEDRVVCYGSPIRRVDQFVIGIDNVKLAVAVCEVGQHVAQAVQPEIADYDGRHRRGIRLYWGRDRPLDGPTVVRDGRHHRLLETGLKPGLA